MAMARRVYYARIRSQPSLRSCCSRVSVRETCSLTGVTCFFRRKPSRILSSVFVLTRFVGAHTLPRGQSSFIRPAFLRTTYSTEEDTRLPICRDRGRARATTYAIAARAKAHMIIVRARAASATLTARDRCGALGVAGGPHPAASDRHPNRTHTADRPQLSPGHAGTRTHREGKGKG